MQKGTGKAQKGLLRAFILTFAFCILNCPSAFALDPSKALSQYQLRAWTSEAGLPANYINAIVHGRDGYLWLGTEEGLARFDGLTFTVFDRRNTPALADHNIQALHEDAQGTLWIGTRGAGLVTLRDGEFTTLSTKDGLPNDRILAITSTKDGTVWVATNGGGLVRYRGGRISVLTTKDGLPDDHVVSLGVDPDGTVWAGTATGGLGHIVDERIETFPAPVPMDALVAVEAARDGTVWVGTRTHGLFRLTQGIMRSVALPGTGAVRVMSIHEDPDGNIWVGTNGHGLLRVHGGTAVPYTTANGFASDVVVIVAEDRDGALWLGTGGAGVVQLRDTAFTPFARREGLSHDIALATLEDHAGALWVGTYGGGLNRLVNGRAEPAGPPSLRQATIYSLLEDSRGSMWVGTDSGLTELTARGAVTHGTGDGFGGDAVYALVEDRAGHIWAGARNGAWWYDGSRWNVIGEREGLGNAFVRALAAVRDGSVWIGTNGGGLARYRDAHLEPVKSADPLANFIRVIHEDTAGNIWIGTSGGGLNLLRDGTLLPLTTKAGLPDDVVFSIVEDRQGAFWMSSNRGIFRALRSELLAAAGKPGTRVSATLFGVGDGMRSAECNGGFQPAAALARDGHLWFPTVRGLVSVDPARATARREPPAVAMEGATINRAAVDVRQTAETPVGIGDLVFRYAGLSLADPSRVRFQYRLEDFDASWIDAGARREAYYTNIPPGRYTFRVRAASGGDWSEPAAFALTLQPRFYQTGLFFTSVVLVVVLVLMGGYRWRLRVLRGLQADLMRLVRERTDELEDVNRKLAQMSYVDAVTAVSNRRSFEEELSMEWRRSTRARSPLSLLMVDVDGFKAFNDALGHQAGDECLRKVATIIDECVQRAGDTVARYGGEEFAILLPDTTSDGAVTLAERIRAAIEERNIWHPGAPGGRLTVSVGVATRMGADEGEPASLVRAADEALYRAKRDGRNRVEA